MKDFNKLLEKNALSSTKQYFILLQWLNFFVHK